MYDIAFIEQYGSGIANVRKLLTENGNKEKEYSLHPIETKVVVYMQSTDRKEIQKYPEKYPEKLNKMQLSIISLIKKDSSITRKQMAEKLGVSLEGTKKNIFILKQKGLIKRIGPDKGGYWETQSG